ncbi:unnamed protein product [Symbiodinium sp. CCMP2592]|nr:unnamed protein product [Symbiodinium sp. CCMP2592]
MPCRFLQGLEGFLPPPRAPSPAPTQLDPVEVDVQDLGGFLDPETPPRAPQYAPSTASIQSVALKELQDEISYPEILRYTDKALRSLLLAEGVLRSKKERPVIMCWSCGSRMEAADSRSTSLRCSEGRACPTRARLSNVDDAFTPFGPTAASGGDKDFATFVRTAWCYGMKAGADQTAHLIREPGENLLTVHKKVQRHRQLHAIALAYSEMEHSQRVRFKYVVVEPDSARFGKRTTEDGSARKHVARTLVLKGRKSKEWTATPLQPSLSQGKRGMPPESLDEVLGPMQKQIRRGCILAPDGGQAFKAAAGAFQKPLLPGVRHGQKLFTPTAVLRGSSCQTETKKRTLTKNIAKKSGRDYKMAAGDNCAEGLLGNIKTTLRRSGGIRAQRDKLSSLRALSAAALLRQPGLRRVLQAHAAYRRALESGVLKLSPTQAYAVNSISWLGLAEDQVET